MKQTKEDQNIALIYENNVPTKFAWGQDFVYYFEDEPEEVVFKGTKDQNLHPVIGFDVEFERDGRHELYYPSSYKNEHGLLEDDQGNEYPMPEGLKEKLVEYVWGIFCEDERAQDKIKKDRGLYDGEW